MHFAHHSVVSASMSAALADELLLGRELLARRRLETASATASWNVGEQWVKEGEVGPIDVTCGGRVLAGEDIPSDSASEVFSGAAIAEARISAGTMIRLRRSLRPEGILGIEPESSTPSSTAAGVPCWIRAIRIADDCHSCNVRLTEAIGGFQVRTTRRISSGEELLLWFSPEVLAILRIPFLAPINIRGEKAYVCHRCGTRMETPNPLKLHLSMDCGRTPGDALWDRLRMSCPLPSPPVLPPQLPTTPVVGLHPTSQNHGQRGGHLCIYCGKLYSRKYGLKIHIRTHTGYKPLKCKFCLRPFGDPSNLNKHIRLHAEGGDAPYRCIQCGKVLVRRRDLERHIKSRHQHHEDASSSDSDFGNKCHK